MKKSIAFFLLLIGLLVLSACNSTESSTDSNENFPEKEITLLVAYAAGGGTDTGARILQSYLEEELGTTVNIENKPGGAGWVAWSELANANPDGYTIGYINSPNIITGYLDPKYDRNENLEDFQFIANHVLDPGVIAIHPDEDRFQDFEEMIEYAQENEITATTSGVGSNDHMAILLMNKHYDTNITPVHTEGASEGSAQVMGGHVDLFVAKVGEAVNHHENGELKAIAVNSEEKSPFLEEVPTTVELGYPEIIHQSARGLAAPADIPDDILEKLSDALEKAITNEEQIEQMETQGLQVHHLGPNEYYELMKKDEEQVESLSDLLGY
ncbi:tripartite tricarboxylate transporter substrate binding protein [Virgibacillus natechei]